MLESGSKVRHRSLGMSGIVDRLIANRSCLWRGGLYRGRRRRTALAVGREETADMDRGFFPCAQLMIDSRQVAEGRLLPRFRCWPDRIQCGSEGIAGLADQLTAFNRITSRT